MCKAGLLQSAAMPSGLLRSGARLRSPNDQDEADRPGGPSFSRGSLTPAAEVFPSIFLQHQIMPAATKAAITANSMTGPQMRQFMYTCLVQVGACLAVFV